MTSYQILYRTVGILFLISVPFTKSKKVHELMTDDEVFDLFHTTRDKIPEYETVAIEYSLYNQSISEDFKIKFKAFDMDVEAYLGPIDGILVGEDTPVWVSENYGGKTHYRKLKQGIMKEVLGVYQSISYQAALVVRSRNRRNVQFRGTIRDMTIIPLPDRVQQEFKKNEKRKRDLSKISCTLATTGCHIVFKSNTDVNQTAADQQSNEFTEKNNGGLFDHIDSSRLKRSYKNRVFPTVLVTTDFDKAVKSNDDSAYYDQILYQMAFWNGVDLRYRALSNPEVRLRIAGFVIGSGRSATPYIERNLKSREIDSYPALQDMQAYWDQLRWNNEFSPEGFHIVATVTNLKMFAKPESEKVMVEGVAAVSSICSEIGYRFYSSALFRDNLGFGGINVAVHELGHVLGANHDNQAKCPSSDGYLMSPSLSRTINNPKWSNCSLESIERTLRWRNCTDKPKEHYPLGKPLERVLPGTLKTADEQCQARGYDWACAATPGICRVLRCYYTGFYGFFVTLLMCQNSWSAAEGTECAPGSYCIDGECQHP